MSNNLNSRVVKIGEISVSNELHFVLFGGVNVLKSSSIAFEVAETFLNTCSDLNIPFVFKASFDKANRSSIKLFSGPGLQKGLQVLADIKETLNVPIITDIHEPDQAEQVAEVVDVIQLPAFLARQTDLILAIAKTPATVNIKKPQFIAPHEIRHIVRKFLEAHPEPEKALCDGPCALRLSKGFLRAS